MTVTPALRKAARTEIGCFSAGIVVAMGGGMERMAPTLAKSAQARRVGAYRPPRPGIRPPFHGRDERKYLSLQEWAEQLVNEAEQERCRIARYLHDTVAQDLSLANMRLGPLVKCLGEVSRPDEAAKLGQVRDLLVQAMEECRLAMADLAPPLLYELGLMPALCDLGRRLENKHAVRIVVTSEGEACLVRPALRGLLFQAVRELLLNAIRHAQPRVVKVTATWCGREMRVAVADDGCGFAVAHHGGGEKSPACLGLFGIRQRLEGVGGRMEITSVPGGGATVMLYVPVSEQAGA